MTHRFGAAVGLWGLCVAGGCGPRKVPSHLQVTAAEPTAAQVAPTTLVEAIEQLVGSDPLVRRPNQRSAEWWASAPDTEPILSWLHATTPSTTSLASLDTLETEWSGTVAVPLARGARLAELEVALPTAPADEQGDRSLVVWLGTFTVKAAPGRTDVRPPLSWIGNHRDAQRQGLVQLAERSVMSGWLENPDLPIAPVAAAMSESQYDRLRDTPEGALIVARATLLRNGARGTSGTTELEAATHLALVQAAADGIRTQRAAQDLARSLATDRGLAPETDPLPPMLEEARVALTADAGSPASLGRALVAVAAQRLDGHCTVGLCTGVDRTATLALAGRQAADAEPVAWAWRVIAAKTALDRLDVAVKQQLPTSAFPLVADIIVGETGQRVPLSLLLQRSMGPDACLTVTRGLGAPDGTRPEDALAAVQAHIGRVCEARPEQLPEAWSPPVAAICTPRE